MAVHYILVFELVLKSKNGMLSNIFMCIHYNVFGVYTLTRCLEFITIAVYMYFGIQWQTTERFLCLKF